MCGTFRDWETDGHRTCKRSLPLPVLQAQQLRFRRPFHSG
jgi:hypothetical protein